MLKIKDVYKVFNVNTINENRVFDGFSLQVEKGEYVSIIGSNGAGKSTLLNLITGNLPVDSGSIMIDGEEVVKKEEYYRCRYIGRVFQNPSVGVAPNMNILENIKYYAATSESRIAIKSADSVLTYKQLEEYSNRLAAFVEMILLEIVYDNRIIIMIKTATTGTVAPMIFALIENVFCFF